MSPKPINMAAAFLALLVCLITPLATAGTDSDKITSSYNVLKEITSIPETGIPPALLSNASGIVIVPDAIKVGLFVGGKYGTGILMVHKSDGTWSNPSFVSLVGGSFGWQIGAQATDLILIFKSTRSIEGIKKGKFTIGADASVAAGPVGRSASASTDVLFKAEILSYSRSRGVFAGVSLEGAALQIDDEKNGYFYGKPGISANDIFTGPPASPSATIWKIKALLTEYGTKTGQ